MAESAARAALADAGLDLTAVQQAYAGYVYGDSTSGQNALYRVGMTGIPVINVNNNCSTGSSALFLARQAVASGAADCVLALGFEQMQRGALKAHWDDRPSAFTRFDEASPGSVAGRRGRRPGGAQVLRRRGRGLLRQVRHGPGGVRAGLGEVAAARGGQPVRGVHRPGDRRGGARLAADLRPADPAAVLPADLRRGGRGRRQRGVRPGPRPAHRRGRSRPRR